MHPNKRIPAEGRPVPTGAPHDMSNPPAPEIGTGGFFRSTVPRSR